MSEITTSDGLRHQGIYAEPQVKKKRAVLWVHGLSAAFYNDYELYEVIADALNNEGWGFAIFNNRGHDLIAGIRKYDGTPPNGYSYYQAGAGSEKFEECVFDIDAGIDFLVEKGLVDPASVRGGAVYKSTEATYADSKELKALNVVLKTLYEFLVIEKEYYNRAMQGKEEFEDELTDPSDENSTELGEIPQKSEDGTMPRYSTYSDTFYGYNL